MSPPVIDRSSAEVATLRKDQEGRPLSPLLKCFSFAAKLMMPDIAALTDERLIAHQRPFSRNPIAVAIAGRRAARVQIRDELISAGEHRLQVRIYSPQRPAGGGTLYLHGGGWIAGDVGICDWWCSHMAVRTGTVVVSLNYRLAPLHRFPGGLEDCLTALNWMCDHSERLNLDPARIGVAGDSAGGNLAAGLCLLAQERNGPRIAFQILIYPTLDLTLSSPSMVENANAPLLSTESMRAFVKRYLGEASPQDPLASPLLAEGLSQMPPTLIQVAQHDPLRDDGWLFASQLKRAGVPVKITEYPGVPHGFVSLPGLTPLAGKALEEACEFSAGGGW